MLEGPRKKSEIRWEFDDGLTAFVYKHKGETHVDFEKKRKFGDVPMVVSMLSYQFMTLYHVTKMVVDAMRKTKDFSYDIGSMLMLRHEKFKDKWSITLREHYTDDKGEVQPGKYGVGISPESFRKLARKGLKEICK